MLCPATDSVEEWRNAILALDHLVFEGFIVKSLREIIDANGGNYEKNWRSLKLLEVSLSKKGCTDDQVRKLVEPLKELRNLRNAVAHGDTKGKDKAVASARKQHHTLRDHFKDIVARVRNTMEQIITTLPKS